MMAKGLEDTLLIKTFQDFCGSEFWNNTLTWYSDGNKTFPDFTKCFQYTVTSWVPCGFLWMMFPFYVLYLRRANDSLRQDVSPLSTTKSILALILCGVSLFELGYTFAIREYNTDKRNTYVPPPAMYLASVLNACTMMLAAGLVQYYRVRGQFTSAILYFYWCLWTLGSAVPLYSFIEKAVEAGSVENIEEFCTVALYFVLVVTELILSCISDATQETKAKLKDECPEYFASFQSFFTYEWLSPTIVQGYKKALEKKDLWKLNPRDVSANHVPAFEKDWNETVKEWKMKKEKLRPKTDGVSCLEVNGDADNNSDTAAIISPSQKSMKTKEPSLSLARVLFKHYGALVLISWACEFIGDWLAFLDPKIQSQLITFVTLRKAYGGDAAGVPLWHGYVLSVGLLLSQFIQTSLNQQVWYLAPLAGLHAKSALISVIYKKSLTMSSEGRKSSTVGEIVNLMSVDASRIEDVMSYLWVLWSAPLQISVALWQLYEVIGVSVFAGFAFMVVMLPINGLVAVKQRSLQLTQMKLKDERIKLMNEVLSGIKVIKLYAWELSFEDKLNAIRAKEMATIRKAWYLRAVQVFGFTAMPFVVTVLTFAVYVNIQPDHVLQPEIAFVSLSLFNIMRVPLNIFPMIISFLVMANISMNRVVNFFKTSDLQEDSVLRDDNCDVSVRIKDGMFSWLPDSAMILRDINVEVPTGSLTAVVGTVGCGKSSLLGACIGDLYKHKGTVVTKGSVAYVAQQAWIQNQTVRENITFGLPFDEEKYQRIIEAVALKPDFDILDQGDLTLIGEKGINLSGGQKQRVSLARACYSEADLYFLDDPLSAVDSHVGRHIFENVIGHNGLLKNKTRVLVTHGVQWLPQVDNIVVLSGGSVSESGSYDALLNHDGPFAEFLKTYLLSDEAILDNGDPSVEKAILDRLESVVEGGKKPLHEMIENRRLQRQLTRTSEAVHETEKGIAKTKSATETPISEESVETGQVSRRVYALYIKSMGMLFASLSLLGMVSYTGVSVFSSIWLSKWTDDPVFMNNSPTSAKQTASTKYLAIYGGLGAIQTLLTLCYTIAFAQCCVRSSTVLHKLLLSNVMRVQMSFFETKPLGLILNRFSKDLETVDNSLGFNYIQTTNNILGVASTLGIIAYTTPIFLIVIIPLGVLYYFIQKFFVPTTRQLQRLESVTRSPVYTHFSETLNGAQTIRAYRKQSSFQTLSANMVDENNLYTFAGNTATRWLSIRLELMAAVIVFLTAIFCVLSTQIPYLMDHINGSLVGLAITYALSSTYQMNYLMQNISALETNMVSVERIKEFSEVPKEADWESAQNSPPRDWPHRGKIEFDKYATRYRPELDLVLQDISFTVNAQEKIGVVGRTGAGKSSLTLSLFRLIEGTSGSIYIDDINIGAIGLHQLRNKVTILPQDPMLFSGSIRSNLDPFSQYSDDRLWEVLEQSHLKNFIQNQPEKLEHDVGEGGHDLSVGQRQLVCLARALLRKKKILLLDEATAAVDLETDDLIQKTIRTAFADCTIITIAHRLNTIIDSNRILVLDRGRVAEYDTPANLLANEKSIFYGMSKDAGLV